MLKEVAQKIVKSTSEVIGYDVLITDDKGIVIGCCDESRLGTLHEASLSVIKMKRPESHCPEVAKMFRGVKPGITLPIELGGRIVGSVGVAMVDDPDVLYKYGMLVKKQTEILLREQIFMKSSVLRDQALSNLLQEICAFDPSGSDELLLLTRGQELGYDLKPPRIAIVIDLFQFASLTERIQKEKEHQSPEIMIQLIKLDAINIIKHVIANRESIIAPVGADKFVVLHFLDYEYDEDKVYSDIRHKCLEIIELMEKQELSATIGVGSIANNTAQLGRSYKDAWQALTIGKRIRGKEKVFFIRDLCIEELLINANKKVSKKFIKNVLKSLAENTGGIEPLKTIKAWCESGFSPLRASKALNIHRNTLLYRINKLEEMSGMNLRDFKQALQLYLAVILLELSENHDSEQQVLAD